MKFSGVIAVAVLAASSWVALPAIAQENTSQQCPKMQFIVVKSTQDSTTDTNSDQGFLGEVVSPVVDAANSGKKVDKSGGFTPVSGDSQCCTYHRYNRGEKRRFLETQCLG